MKRKNKIIAILGMISFLSLTGCHEQMEIPTGDYTTIDEDKKEDLETSDEAGIEAEETEEVEEPTKKDEINEYTLEENLEDFVCVLSIQSPLSDNFKSYTFVKEMDYTTNSKYHPENSPLYDDITEIVGLSHLENKEEVLNGTCEFTLVKYQSTSSDTAVYGEKIYNITYDSNGEEKKVELKEQQFGDSEENMYFYVLTTTTEEGIRYDWSFIDNEENGYYRNNPVPFEIKRYSYYDVMSKLIEYEEKEATLGLNPQN